MMRELLLPEFDEEMAGLRRTLERLPDDRFEWRPHEKSYSLGELATHLATLPSWTVMTLQRDELDLAPPGQPPLRAPLLTTRAQVLAGFDEQVAAARAALAEAGDEVYGEPWTLLSGGHALFTLPKGVVLRRFVFNHVIHHRAQMTVYLRLLGVAVPALYGPSADEAA